MFAKRTKKKAENHCSRLYKLYCPAQILKLSSQTHHMYCLLELQICLNWSELFYQNTLLWHIGVPYIQYFFTWVQHDVHLFLS